MSSQLFLAKIPNGQGQNAFCVHGRSWTGGCIVSMYLLSGLSFFKVGMNEVKELGPCQFTLTMRKEKRRLYNDVMK